MYSEILNSLSYDKKKRTYNSSIPNLEKIGFGKRATVFKLFKKDLVIKVFHPNKESSVMNEVNVYRMLSEKNKYYCQMVDHGDNYIVLEYRKGKTFLECMMDGEVITDYMIEQVEEGIQYALERGLNPSDIHIKNLIWDGQRVSIIDLEGFLREKKCYRWNSFKKFHKRFYKKFWFPKKISKETFDFFALTYRRLELFLGKKQKK